MIKLVSLQANNFKQLQNIDLRFPSQGSVLIEGRNEAGKSTLFEAIFFALFGKPLLTGTTADDLIGYQANDAIVILEIEGRDQRYVIQRKIRRTKSRSGTDARVRVYDGDGAEGEEVRGSSAVNQRLQQELKLDADAFLNSCFVEQKKLEKLEGLNAKDRETSLMRLLNMDRMLDEERSLRITVEDTRRLQRLEQRVRLAEVMAEIPDVAKRGRECRTALDIIALKEGLATIEACRRTIVSAEARLASLVEPVKALEDRIRRIGAIRDATSSAKVVAVHIAALEQQAIEIARYREQLTELDRVAAEELPALRQRLAGASRLRARWQRLLGLDAEASRADAEREAIVRCIREADVARQAIAEMESRLKVQAERIAVLEAEERTLAVAERTVTLRQALEDWQAAAHARNGLGELEAASAEAKRDLEEAGVHAGRKKAVLDALRRGSSRCVARGALGVLALLVLAALGAVLKKPVLWAAAAVPALWTAIQAIQWKSGLAKTMAAEADLRHLEERTREAQNACVRIEGQMENAKATSGAAAERLEQAVIRLEALGETAPAGIEEAERRRALMPDTDETIDPQRLADLRKDLAQAQGAVEEQRRAIKAKQQEVDAVNVAVLKASADRLETRATRIREAIIDPWEEAARERATDLGIESGDTRGASREAASGAEARLAEQIRQTEHRLTERPSIEHRISQAQAAGQREHDGIIAAWPSVAAVRPEASLPATSADAAALQADLSAELEALDEPAVRADLRAQQDARTAAQTDLNVAQRESARAEAELRRCADNLRYPSDAPLSADSLAEALPGWDAAEPGERATLEAEFEALKEQNAGLMARRKDLAEALDLDPKGARLTPDKERAQRDDVLHDQCIRERAITILRAARERIMSKVLPYTIEHMRRILPALTMERYHDAKLTPDYKIEVWDERASMWKAKNIFSGGTRDQFSLALRLAFAVATLPQERGAAPGFIFLDEPLSSFDVERSNALMYLLTKGEIADAFDQILVISHSQTIATDDFQYHLYMDGGCVMSSSSEEMRGSRELELANGD